MCLKIFADNAADGNLEGNGGILGAKFGYKTATHYPLYLQVSAMKTGLQQAEALSAARNQ